MVCTHMMKQCNHRIDKSNDFADHNANYRKWGSVGITGTYKSCKKIQSDHFGSLF